MKSRNFLYIGLFLLGGTLVLSSCKKEFNKIINENTDEFQSYMRFYNASLSTVRNYVYVNNVAVTGPVVAYGGLFPSTGYYASLTPGSNVITIKDTLATSAQPVGTFSNVFEQGKRYTVFSYDTVTRVKYKLVQDDLVVPTDTTARLRFANMIHSSATIPNVDIYSTRRGANIFTNISPATVTSFIPYASHNDTLYVRATGTTTNLSLPTAVFSINPTAKRNYTLVFRGNYTTTGTATLARRLELFANQ